MSNNDHRPTHLQEFHRQRRLVDQSATMHSTLRDRFTRRARALRLAELILSVFGLGFAFAADGVSVTILGQTAARPTWLGAMALLVFCMTIIDLVIDPAGIAARHDGAVRSLAALKGRYRVTPPEEEIEEALEDLGERYEVTMDSIPPIPERLFLSLKSRHLRKVAVSKLLSAHPGLGPVAATWSVWSKSTADAVAQRTQSESGRKVTDEAQ